MSITSLDQLDLNQQYTYADYMTWQLRERVEIFRGWIAAMAPAPSRFHQAVARNMTGLLFNAFNDHLCELYPAPFDVRLPNTAGGETVVQPDLCVICDLDKLTDQGCTGAPDWIIEILSPGNSKREMKTKYELYQESGVKEYWLVNPLESVILRFVLRDGIYAGLAPVTDENEAIECSFFPELRVRGEEVFRR